MKIILYVSSIVVAAVTVLFFIEENISAEWRARQFEYKRLLATKEGAVSEEFDIELRQIYLPEMNRVDRCVSCHISIEDPRFADDVNPHKAHPGDYLEDHDPQKFGCTVCHDGQGRAIAWEDASATADGKHWEKPLLAAPFIEANCYRCHSGELAQTPNYNRGRHLFENSGCLGCHQRDGKGGYLAPEFRGLADASFTVKHPVDSLKAELLPMFNNNRNLAYIYESVLMPTAQPENSVMLDYGFSHEDALSLTVYLKSLGMQSRLLARLSETNQERSTVLEQGKKTFQLYCSACHGADGGGGVKNPNYQNDVIPSLDLIAERMFLFEQEDGDEIINAIQQYGNLNDADPEPDLPRYAITLAQYNAIRDVIINGNPAAKLDAEGASPFNMPSWKKSLSAGEMNAVIAYLVSLYDFEEDEEDEE